MKTCLVLGGGDTLDSDLKRYSGPIDGVVACNEAGTVWPDQLDAWISLHPHFFESKGWRQAREDNGYIEAWRYYTHEKNRITLPDQITTTEHCFPDQPNSGSSGLFAAKVALIDLGFDRAVLCGIPMTQTPHFWDTNRIDWKAAEDYRRLWLTVPDEYLARMRSMSGWTRVLLGEPE